MSLFGPASPPVLETDAERIAELAPVIGAKTKEVLGYFEIDDGIVIGTVDGTFVAVLTRMDSLGRQPGTVLAYVVPGQYLPRSIQIGVYEASGARPLMKDEATLDSLIREAAAVQTPGIATRSALDAQAWAGADPARAVVIWRWQAGNFGLSLDEVCEHSPLAAHMREIVRAAGISA